MIDQQIPAQTGGQTPRWQIAAICLALAALTLAVFGQTWTHGFVNYDDDLYVYANPLVIHGLTAQGIVWNFTHADCSLYHPLTMLSLMADSQLYGSRAGGYHLTSVLLHTATAILLFLVLRQMTGAFWRSAFVAAVFAIHPLRVESVAWIAERKDVLSGLFFVLTIWAYARYAKNPQSLARFGLVMLFFIMGLLCKPMLVTLPLVLLFLDYWPLQRTGTPMQLIMEKAPLFVLSVAACVATYMAPASTVYAAGSYTLPPRMANTIASCKVYLDQMIFPSGLAVIYPLQLHQSTGGVALAAVILAAISLGVWVARRKQPWLLTGWLWYLVMLLPVAGIVQVGVFAHADRYTYLPQIGIYIMIAWLVAELRINQTLIGIAMAGVIAALSVCAWKQTATWRDSQTLWAHALACTKDNYVAHLNLGKFYMDEGKADQAMDQFQEVLRIKPRYADAHYDLGNALMAKDKLNDAIAQFQAAIDIDPNNAGFHNNLGSTLCRTGRLDEGMTQFQQALQINPNFAQAHNNLGNAYTLKGRLDDAISQYQQALQLDPTSAQTRQSLQKVMLQKEQTGTAPAR